MPLVQFWTQESRLKHADVVGLECKCRQGFRNLSDILWSKASKLQRRELIKKEIQKGEEESQVKAVGMAKQGAWTR